MQRYGFASAPISNGGYNNYFIIIVQTTSSEHNYAQNLALSVNPV